VPDVFVATGDPGADEAGPPVPVDRGFGRVDAERRVDAEVDADVDLDADRGVDPWVEDGPDGGGPAGFDVERLVGADPAPGMAALGATDGAEPAPNVQASALPACGW
jgi:hypothetical protein